MIFSLGTFSAFSQDEQLSFDQRNQQIAEEACKGEAFNGDCHQQTTNIVDQHGSSAVSTVTGLLIPYAWKTLTNGFFKNIKSLFKFKFKLSEEQKSKIKAEATSHFKDQTDQLNREKSALDLDKEEMLDLDAPDAELKDNANKMADNKDKIDANKEAIAARAEEKEKLANKGKASATLSKICDIAVIGSNLVVGGLQVVREKKIDAKYYATSSSSIHAEGFYAMAQTHEGKRKDHKAQHIIFTASTICYGAAMTIALIPKPGINPAEAKRAGVKMALSIPLALAFKDVKKEREKLRDATMDAISRLGTKSICEKNSNCMCSPSMKDHPDYQNFCLDMNFAVNSEGENTSCLDSRGKLDRNCSCLQTNSCFDKTVQNYFATVDNDILPLNAQKKILSDIRNIATGQYQKSESSFAKDEAYANKKIAQLDSLIQPAAAQHSASFNAAIAAGLPNNIAAALSNINPEDLNKAALSGSPTHGGNALSGNGSYKVGSSKAAGFKAKKTGSTDYFSNYLNSMKKKAPSKGGVHLTRSVANNAVSNAAIRSSHQELFKTISTRYQKSSYRLE